MKANHFAAGLCLALVFVSSISGYSQDTDPPTVSSLSPANGATDVSIAFSNVYLYFNEPLLLDNLSETVFYFMFLSCLFALHLI